MAQKKFTDAFLRQAKYTGDKPYISYNDDGLILRISKKEKKTFYYKYLIHGKMRWYKIGTYPDTSLKQARIAVRKARADLIVGKDPQEGKDSLQQTQDPIDMLTVADALDKFVERHAKRNLVLRVWKQYKSGYEHLPAHIRKTNIHELKAITISDHIESLHETRAKAINLLLALKSAFSWLHGKGYIKENVVRDIKRPFKKNSRDRVLTKQELQAILKVCQDMGYPYGDSTLILAYTGQRKSEVSDMKWSELDLENGIWTLPAGRSKNKKTHKIPLPSTVITLLKNMHRQEGDYVFSTTGGKKPIAHGGKIKTKLNKAVGFDNWIIHDLRRTTATNLAQQGASDIVISSILNHSKDRILGITSIYNRYDYLEECGKALETYGQWLDRLASDENTDNIVPLIR